MTEQIVIAGTGCITALGTSLDATWGALLAGQYVADRGVVPIERDDRPRTEQLATIAVREAIGDAAVSDAALFVGTSKGPADQWLDDGHVGAYGLATLADGLARAIGCTGPRHTSSAACASGLHALAAAVVRMRHEGLRRAIVVASESSLHGIWSATFRRLGVLAKPGEPGRPFDVDRDGFVIGEAAAAILLERRLPRAKDVVVHSAQVAGDAHHLTAPDPTGRALRWLIRQTAGDEPIDLVHAHATATGSDAIELAAIVETLGPGPAIYSHKGSIGHTLGSSGLIATVLTDRALREQRLPQMATTRQSIVASDPSASRRGMNRAIILAAGFGGAAAAARLDRIDGA